MRFSIDDEHYRLVFRYGWAKPVGREHREYEAWADVPQNERDFITSLGIKPEAVYHKTTTAELLREIGSVSAPGTPEDGKPAYEVFATGTSRCSPLDAYNKERGRKGALKRALESEKVIKELGGLTLSGRTVLRGFRSRVWEGYFDRLPKAPEWEKGA